MAPSLLATPDASPPVGSSDEGWSTAAPAPQAPADAPATPQVSQGAGGARWVNSLTFDIDYDLQTVGPWGVAKVELWATRDGGQTWTSLGVDPDNRSPVRATAPGPGVYGFRILVDGANSAPAPPPKPGDNVELTLGIDLSPPRAELQTAQLGSGNLSDRVVIRWTAADERLDARPVSLFYSDRPDGPWSTIATNLENTGEYSWRLVRQMPARIFLRLEARDVAGNVATSVSRSPTELNLPQPTGRLRSVRPVTAIPAASAPPIGSPKATGQSAQFQRIRLFLRRMVAHLVVPLVASRLRESPAWPLIATWRFHGDGNRRRKRSPT